MNPLQFAAKLQALAESLGEPTFAVLSDDAFDDVLKKLQGNSAAVMEAECGMIIVSVHAQRAGNRAAAEKLAELLNLCCEARRYLDISSKDDAGNAA